MVDEDVEDDTPAGNPLLPTFLDPGDFYVALDAVMRFTAPRPGFARRWLKPMPQPRNPSAAEVEEMRVARAQWERRGIDEAERHLFISVGLRWHEHDLAYRCMVQGIKPQDLALPQHGRTMLDYLRSGEGVAQVWARIQEVA